jgi:hypothetical protein
MGFWESFWDNQAMIHNFPGYCWKPSNFLINKFQLQSSRELYSEQVVGKPFGISIVRPN